MATNWFGDGPLVLRNAGDGTFHSPSPIAGASDVGALATSDLDGDSALDVAVSAVGSSVVSVYAGDVRGGLTEHGRLPVVRQPQTPVIADFDADGDADIVVPGVGHLSVLRNTAAPAPRPTADPPSTATPTGEAGTPPPQV